MPGVTRGPRRGTSADADDFSENSRTHTPEPFGNSAPATPSEQPLSHAAARKARKRRKTLDADGSDSAKNAVIDSTTATTTTTTTTTDSANTTTPPPSNPPSPRTKPRKPPNNPPRKPQNHPAPPSIPPSPASMPPTPLRPLLICSLGNPPPTYAHTLHSAGHAVLSALRPRLPLPYTPFSKDKTLGGGLTSRPGPPPAAYPTSFLFRRSGGGEDEGAEIADDWTLWQSPALMNASGRAVADAWRKWLSGAGAAAEVVVRARRERGQLVVVHDELERELGWVGARRGGSARGHNGVKSVQKALPGVDFVRIGVGIGRPASREPEEVARYVLRKMTERERDVIEDCSDRVIGLLREIEEGKV